MPRNPICRRCGVELNDENWHPSNRKKRDCICKECKCEQHRRWYQINHDNAKAINTRVRRKQGERPYNENKECASYLGVHIAERVLSYVFKDVEKMPYGNPGFDFICSRDKRIDVKSSCLHKDSGWKFHIRRNTTPDYFLCLAFDNREDLNPLYAWLIPGNVVNHLTSTSISPNTVSRWSEYALDISKISDCCVTMRAK